MDALAPVTLPVCVVADDGRLLLLRRAFSRRTDPGAWAISLRCRPATADERPLETARRGAMRLLGLRLEQVGHLDLGAAPVAVGRARQQVVTPDPTEFDDAEWVEWPDLLRAVGAGAVRLVPRCAAELDRLRRLDQPPARWGPTAG